MRLIYLFLLVVFYDSFVKAVDFPANMDDDEATQRFLKRLSPSLRKKLEKFKEENKHKDFIDEDKFARENLNEKEMKELRDAMMMSLHGQFGDAVDDMPGVFADAQAKGEKIGKKRYEGRKAKKKEEL